MISSSKSIFGFDPRTIPGCQLWLDAADSSTITLSSGKVTQWNDKSGNGYNFTQATSGNQPTYSTASLNNQNTITFTSVNSTYLLGTASTTFMGTNSISVYGVFKTNNNTSSSAVFSKSLYGSAAGRILYGFRESGTPGTIAGGIGVASGPNAYTAISDTYTAGAWRVFGFVSDRSGWTNTTYQNGTSIGSTTITVDTTTNLTNAFPMLVGAYNNSSGGASPPQAGYYLDGAVGELLVFSSALTTSQRQQVEGYLAHKWGLTGYYFPTTPLTIPGCQLWLDGADPAGTGTPPASGATVSSWNDKSGNGKNSTATGTSTYLSGGGINFTGSSYFLNQTFTMNLSQRSIFIVMQETSHTDVAGVFPLIPTPNSGNDFQSTTGLSIETSGGICFYGNNGGYISFLGSSSLLVKGIYNDNMNGTTGSGFFNGTNATNVTANYTAGTCSGYGIGGRWIGGSMSGSYRLNGVVHEIIVFNTALTTTQRQTIEGYLARKWGLTTLYSAIPSTHPFYSVRPYLRAFQPTDISGCQLWLDGADTSTLTVSGSSVSSWRDKSGNNNNATQPTLANQPTTGTLLNGLNVLDFTGTQPYFSFPTISYTNITVFTIFRNTTLRAYCSPLFIGPFFFFFTDGAGNSLYGTGRLGINGEGIISQAAAGIKTTNYLLYSLNLTVGDTDVVNFYINGTNAANFNGSASGGRSYYQVGSTDSVGATTGFTAEILVYNGVLNNSQRQQVEGYLAWKWGLRSNLPAGHPYINFPPSP